MSEEIKEEVSIADELIAEADEQEKEQIEQQQSEANEKQERERDAKKQQAMMLAYGGVQAAATFAEKKWSCLSFDDKTKTEVADKTAAVLAKYDLQMPPWLAAFKEEIELGLVLGGVVASAYIKVQKWKKEEAENAEQDTTEGVASGHQPQQ